MKTAEETAAGTAASKLAHVRLVNGGAAVEEGGAAVQGSGGKKRKRVDGDAADQQGAEEVRRVRLVCGEVEVLVTEHHLDKMRKLFGQSHAAADCPQQQLSKRELKKQRKQLNNGTVGTGTGTVTGTGTGPSPAPGSSAACASAGAGTEETEEAAFLDAAFCVLG